MLMCFLPPHAVTYDHAMKIYQYTNSTKNPIASVILGKTLIHTKPAPVIAALTSRGPNVIEPNILKVDKKISTILFIFFDIKVPLGFLLAYRFSITKSIQYGFNFRTFNYWFASQPDITAPGLNILAAWCMERGQSSYNVATSRSPNC